MKCSKVYVLNMYSAAIKKIKKIVYSIHSIPYKCAEYDGRAETASTNTVYITMKEFEKYVHSKQKFLCMPQFCRLVSVLFICIHYINTFRRFTPKASFI